VKCNYCDFEYEKTSKYVDHLNACHYRCGSCGDVVDTDKSCEMCERDSHAWDVVNKQNDD